MRHPSGMWKGVIGSSSPMEQKIAGQGDLEKVRFIKSVF